jgi:SAM-dependent methyltransferase
MHGIESFKQFVGWRSEVETSVYALESEVEAEHWWFVGRRRLLSNLISQLGIRQKATILDVGTGTGNNLRLLQELGFKNVTGLDSSEEAIRFCQQKGLGLVKQGDVCNIPFPDNNFDVVFATDIIEHVEDDIEALSEIRRILKPEGKVILTVPAFQSLWGIQDVIGHHKRRYRMKPLLATIRAANLIPVQNYYFNYILFVPIWLARQMIKGLNLKIENENQVNTSLLNQIFTWIFNLDVFTAPFISPPFGVSILVVAHKKV